MKLPEKQSTMAATATGKTTMFNFIKSWFTKKPIAPAVITWVGTAEGFWKETEDEPQTSIFFSLYEDNNGVRSYKITGSHAGHAKQHMTYTRVVIPWMGGCDVSQVYRRLHNHNDLYWNSRGYSVNLLDSDYQDGVEPAKPRKVKKVAATAANNNVIAFPGA